MPFRDDEQIQNAGDGVPYSALFGSRVAQPVGWVAELQDVYHRVSKLFR